MTRTTCKKFFALLLALAATGCDPEDPKKVAEEAKAKEAKSDLAKAFQPPHAAKPEDQPLAVSAKLVTERIDGQVKELEKKGYAVESASKAAGSTSGREFLAVADELLEIMGRVRKETDAIRSATEDLIRSLTTAEADYRALAQRQRSLAEAAKEQSAKYDYQASAELLDSLADSVPYRQKLAKQFLEQVKLDSEAFAELTQSIAEKVSVVKVATAGKVPQRDVAARQELQSKLQAFHAAMGEFCVAVKDNQRAVREDAAAPQPRPAAPAAKPGDSEVVKVSAPAAGGK